MNRPRRQFLHLAAGVVALPAVSRFARAQTYPMQPVRLIVGFAAGGGNDITARLMGQCVSMARYFAERIPWTRRAIEKTLFELDQTHVQQGFYFTTVDGRVSDELLSGNLLQESA